MGSGPFNPTYRSDDARRGFSLIHLEDLNDCIALKPYRHVAGAYDKIAFFEYRQPRSTPRNFVNSKLRKHLSGFASSQRQHALRFLPGARLRREQRAVRSMRLQRILCARRDPRRSQLRNGLPIICRPLPSPRPCLVPEPRKHRPGRLTMRPAVSLPFSFAQPMGADCGIIH